jgi:predicted metal-dependent TIM-barrel fold hydrolase
LCASPAADDEAVRQAIIEALPDDFDFETDHLDAVRIKRALEAEFNVTLTVSQTKRHVKKAARRGVTRELLQADGGERR